MYFWTLTGNIDNLQQAYALTTTLIPGSMIQLTLLRRGGTENLTVTVGEKRRNQRAEFTANCRASSMRLFSSGFAHCESQAIC